MKSKIYNKLKDFFNPEYLEVINESSNHTGHAGSPNNGNSHFYIKIKSEKFNNKKLIDSHKIIYSILKQEMCEEIHALRIKIL
jgi:BolA protein